MQTAYPKRLIEVDLPIKRISAHSRREKSIRQGHIATMHLWWARRPLAACRAVICASLWPDPADRLCPGQFIDTARSEMMKWASSNLNLLSSESYARFVAISKNHELLDNEDELRGALLDFIADAANWDNSSNAQFLETTRKLSQVAHESLGGQAGTQPIIVDPFAGGGAIPLEALRVGASAHASDLNPVPVLLNKVQLEYLPKYGEELANAIRKWGDEIGHRAMKKTESCYPVDSVGKPIAYLWARTIISEAPAAGSSIPVEVPMLKSMWLAKKGSHSAALRWKRNTSGDIIVESVERDYSDGKRQRVSRPLMEIFEPKSAKDLDEGTISRGSVTCPITGYTTPVKSVRSQLIKRRGGTRDARMLAVRRGDRSYRLPNQQDVDGVNLAEQYVSENWNQTINNLSVFPDEPTPTNDGHRAVGSPWIYGMREWRDLYSARQLMSIDTIRRCIEDVKPEILASYESGLARAVITCLGISLSRLTDFMSSLCILNFTGGRGVVHTFGRQALQMVSDFMESNPFNDVAANWDTCISTSEKTIKHESCIQISGSAHRINATNLSLPDQSIDCFVTDPPYYDSVSYADLSDYFYVWLKRTLYDVHQELFSETVTPKEEQAIVWHPNSKDERRDFEEKMGRAMEEGRRILKPGGIGIVVFAHKSTSGWESQLSAMVDAGWVITGSWPIDTERAGRINAQNTASLASTIHLVCRPRDISDQNKQDGVGEWRDVLAELPRRIHEWMPRLESEGVVGADAIFACLGPALEIYSRYDSVERASGQKVELKEYLEEVWAAVSKEALNMVFKGADASGFEEDSRLTAMWLWTLSTAENGNGENGSEATASTGYSLEYDAARKIAQGLGAHLERLQNLVEIVGDKARLLPVSERTSYLFGKESTDVPRGKRKKKDLQTKMAFLAELEEAEEQAQFEGTLSHSPGSTVLDRIHQSMILFAAGRGEALKRFLVEEGIGRDPRFWKLAQALSALYPKSVDEKRWVDGVLAKKKGFGL